MSAEPTKLPSKQFSSASLGRGSAQLNSQQVKCEMTEEEMQMELEDGVFGVRAQTMFL